MLRSVPERLRLEGGQPERFACWVGGRGLPAVGLHAAGGSSAVLGNSGAVITACVWQVLRVGLSACQQRAGS